MEFKNRDELVIQKYQEDEQMMILLFVQWCINHNLDATELYARAYPQQGVNPALQKTLSEITDKEKIEIDDETMLDVLQLFGNFELALILSEEIEKAKRS